MPHTRHVQVAAQRSVARPGPLDEAHAAAPGAHSGAGRFSPRGAGVHSPDWSEASPVALVTPAYTGAALLAKYTGRRKLLQRAATLSTQMRDRVQDVVQMEEEQRLLSQAFRGRQKLVEQQRPQEAPVPEPDRARGKGGAGSAGAATGSAAPRRADGGDSATALGLSGDMPPLPSATGAAATEDDGDSRGSLATTTAGIDTGIGLVLDGAGDLKRFLEQQAQDKSDTLGKMRGLQQAILELSEEAVADEERLRAKLRYEASSVELDGLYPEYAATAGTEASALSDSMPRQLPSVELGTKVETIREMRSALRDMVDAHQAPFAAAYILGSGGSGQRPTSAAVPGNSWLDRDAHQRPPAPPQVFSTSAFAVTLEYLSNSIACIARVADEVCVATTSRSRTDRVDLRQHLDSLHKWMAQTDRCLDTAQRHLRHFQLGEVAVMDGGAFELNSLREQILLLKESLTAQEQKVKSAQEAKTSAQHRLRDITRRCYLWETRLLHRASVAPEEMIATVAAATTSGMPTTTVENMSSNGSTAQQYYATPTTSEPNMPMDAAGDGEEGDYVAFGLRTSVSHSRETEASVSLEGRRSTLFTPLLQAAGDEGALPSSSGIMTSATTLRAFLRSGNPSARLGSAAAPAPRVVQPSPYVLAHQEPSNAALRAMEQRVARSWFNPYVRKQQLKRRSEEAAAARRRRSVRRQTGTGFAQDRSQELQRQSAVGVDGSRQSTGLGSGNQLTAEGVRAPTSNPANVSAFDSPIALRAESGDGQDEAQRPSARLGPHALIAASTAGASGNNASVTDAARTVSRRADSSTAETSSTSGATEELVAELADVRTLQLMQSLLRSLPSRRAAPPGPVRGKGHSEDRGDMSRPSLLNSVTLDASHEDEQRVSTRQSMQRLVRYLTTATTKLTPGAPMLASKK